MQNLFTEGTGHTPAISFNAAKGELIISGRSIHGNPVVIYQPLIDWIAEYAKEPRPYTTFIVKLEYYNTTSSKYLLDVFRKLKEIERTGNIVTIKWHHEQGDEDMIEAAREHAGLVDLPFETVEEKE